MSVTINLQLNQLEDEIQKLFDNGDLSDTRTAFEIGVKFGRELQQENINNYECIFWKKRDLLIKSKVTKAKEIYKINQLFHSLILKSIKEKIDEFGSWSISDNDSDLRWSKFSDDTVGKYCVQYTGTGVRSYDDFNCTFKVTGKLRDLFNNYEVGEKLTSNITNTTGDSYMDICDKIFIIKNLKEINSCLEYKHDWPLEKLKAFHDALVKLFLFELIE
jgi:hypothetical protein